MSEYVDELWKDNPFTFADTRAYEVRPSMINKLGSKRRNMFDKLKVKFVRQPPAKTNPMAPIGAQEWLPEYGMSDVMISTMAPNPAFRGLPRKRRDEPTSVGTKGFNTHYNIIVDQSGSMQAVGEVDAETGDVFDRADCCRIAAAILIQQMADGLNSFTVFGYNNTGRIIWPVSGQGEPSYDYDNATEWLIGDGTDAIMNNLGTSTKGGMEMVFNAFQAMRADGGNNENAVFEETISYVRDNDIGGMITIFITDGQNLAGPVTQGAGAVELTGGMTYDEWLRNNGKNPLFYIVVGSPGDEAAMESEVVKTLAALAYVYNLDANTLSQYAKYVWMLPSLEMTNPENGEPLTGFAEQAAWLFAEMGKISRGISAYFSSSQGFDLTTIFSPADIEDLNNGRQAALAKKYGIAVGNKR